MTKNPYHNTTNHWINNQQVHTAHVLGLISTLFRQCVVFCVVIWRNNYMSGRFTKVTTKKCHLWSEHKEKIANSSSHLSLSPAHSMRMKCDFLRTMLRPRWWHLGWPNDYTLAQHWQQMTTLEKETCNYFKTKSNPATYFFKVCYTCMMYSGTEGSICKKKILNSFYQGLVGSLVKTDWLFTILDDWSLRKKRYFFSYIYDPLKLKADNTIIQHVH